MFLLIIQSNCRISKTNRQT